MKFADPRFLYALALLLPVLIAFLVRKNRDVLRVPSTMVWRLGARSRAKSRRLKDIRRWLALAACLGAVAALALAASRPAGKGGGAYVFVVDASSSMSGAPIEEARRWMTREVTGLGADARIAIVRAGVEARVVLPPTPPGPRVDEAIRAISTESDSSAIEQAVGLAEGLAGQSGRIVVLSDAPIDARVSRRDHKRDYETQMRIFGRGKAAPDNLGITGLFTRAAPEARDDEERDCTVSVATSSDARRRARLVVTLAGRAVADRRIELEPKGETTEHVAIRGSGRIVATVTPDDGLHDAITVDDEAKLDEVSRDPPRVALVRAAGGDEASDADIAAFFVGKALRAAGVKDVVSVTAGEPAPTGIDVVVALADGPGRPHDVPTFFIGTNPDAFDHVRIVAKTQTHLRSVAAEDPLLRGVSFDGVTILRAQAPAEPPRGARALVELDGGPVLLAGGAGARAWVWLGIEPASSDMVLRVAFPVLVANVVAQLGGGTQVVAAKTAPRSEVALTSSLVQGDPTLAPASEPRWRVPATPAMLLAVFGAILLGLEAWLSFRRKWAL